MYLLTRKSLTRDIEPVLGSINFSYICTESFKRDNIYTVCLNMSDVHYY